MKIRLTAKDYGYVPCLGTIPTFVSEDGLKRLVYDTDWPGSFSFLVKAYCDVFGGTLKDVWKKLYKEVFEKNTKEEQYNDLVKLFGAYTGPKLIAEEVVDLKVEDPNKKALLEALGEYYDQFEAIGCKTPEEAVRLGLDAFFGKLKEPKVLPDMELCKIDDLNAAYEEGKVYYEDVWREVGGVKYKMLKNRKEPFFFEKLKAEMRGDK